MEALNERRRRLLRIARERGDRLAVATLETATTRGKPWPAFIVFDEVHKWTITESELRALWGDR